MTFTGCLNWSQKTALPAGKQWGTSQYVREGLLVALEGADALVAAKAYVNAVEDAQEAA